MLRIADAYGPDRFGLSFELFPPKTEKGERALFCHVEELAKFNPSFITCTYGAGGSTRDKTLDVVQQVHARFGCAVASHLTCVAATTGQLRDYLHETRRRGIGNIVALRGDPPRGESAFKPAEGGLRFANELVALIRREFPEFGIAVAGYPETHQEAENPQSDLENLQRKVDAGANAVITQLFYDNTDFFDFRDRCEKLGIDVPIVPGLLPVTNLAQIQRITSLCGAQLPPDFIAQLTDCADDESGQFEVGVEFAIRQTQELLDAGVAGIHFYVLNKSQSTTHVLRNVTIPSSAH